MRTSVAIFVLALFVLAILLGPLATLWALNTISEEAKLGWYIPHTIWTYVPVWVLMIFWKSTSATGK